MSDLIRPDWTDGEPVVYVYVRRHDKASERDRVTPGDVVVHGNAIHCGGTIWDRRINLGLSPSYEQVREAVAKLTADALTALEGQR